MKQVFILLLVMVFAVSLMGFTVTPYGSYNSDNVLKAGVAFNMDTVPVDLDLNFDYDVFATEFVIDGLLVFEGDSGVLKVKSTYDSIPASPTLGFLIVSNPISIAAFDIQGIVGTGYFGADEFGTTVLGDMFTNNTDISALGKLSSGLSMDNFALKASIFAGYYVLDNSYGVGVDAMAKLFDIVDIKASMGIYPIFEWSVFASATFEF